MPIDFGYGEENNEKIITKDENDVNTSYTSLDNEEISHDKDDDIDNLDNIITKKSSKDSNDNKDNDKDDKDKNDNKDNDKDNKNAIKLEKGTPIEFENNTYTVDDNGNIVDKDGNIFKTSEEAEEWVNSLEIDDSDNAISIDSIQDAIGIQITDENDKPVQFDNTIEGITSYVNAVIENSKEEHYETAINTLYQKYPFLNNILNYYIANGNSLDGFGEVKDRSNITIDENNEEQQENIIRTAWKEQNRKGDVESYIQYLKSSGILLDTAKEELRGLQESDEQYKQQLEEEAERKEQEYAKKLQKYWDGVHDIIKNRKIAGYQIPESIIINRNGQKISVTPDDFFNYLYRVDQNGKSAYNRDLANQTPESRRDDEILRAYLMFTGGNYSNLIDMAINNEKVNKLKLKAKERTHINKIKLNKPANKKEIDFGYN